MLKPRLTAKQFAVLALLWQHPGEACTRDEIGRTGWPEREAGGENTDIDTCIYNLRNRLAKNGLERNILENVQGYGYKLVERPLEDQEAS